MRASSGDQAGPPVAFKVEVTSAMFDYGNTWASDLELFLSLSYQWELVHK